MADSKGWIKTYRKLQDCWIWLDKEPFDRRSAWIDLLLTANHSDKKILFNGELITVKRGQILTSIRKLSEKWKWSYEKCTRFLKILESDGMLHKQSDNFRTLLTIVNYEVYQDVPNTNECTDKCTDKGTSRTRASEQSEHEQVTNKNVKNDKEWNKNEKNVKNNIFVPPTVDEVKEYLFSVGSSLDAESFVAFYESKGWMVGKNKMKSWKNAIVTWEKRAGIKRTEPKKEPLPFEPTEEEREMTDEEWLKMMQESDL